MTLWENLKKGLVDGLHTATDKTTEYTKIGRIKIDLLGLKKELEEKLVELGGRVYQAYDEKKEISLTSDMKIKQLLTRISELDQELKNYQKELKRIKENNGLEID
ncbi:MAG: hypothetical protein JXR46_13695 [Calditrichaceae bacterium]|nr:hypothetical protein [Calditrichaceae bacterium]MBN2710089.1 hypothetical protein [Calditrichaceae bacterium]RQV94258.1 MAG: hypothetical protein EH224_10460 [Calditrichota bacterium]